jgi:hypothetical protein
MINSLTSLQYCNSYLEQILPSNFSKSSTKLFRLSRQFWGAPTYQLPDAVVIQNETQFFKHAVGKPRLAHHDIFATIGQSAFPGDTVRYWKTFYRFFVLYSKLVPYELFVRGDSMKLDTKALRYLSTDDWRVLTAV